MDDLHYSEFCLNQYEKRLTQFEHQLGYEKAITDIELLTQSIAYALLDIGKSFRVMSAEISRRGSDD